MYVISKDTDQSAYIAIITPCLHCIIAHNAQNSTPIHQILTSLYSWASSFETCLVTEQEDGFSDDVGYHYYTVGIVQT